MPDSFRERFRKAFNVFRYGEEYLLSKDIGIGYGYRQDRYQFYLGTERSIIASVYNRIAIDVSSIPLRHVRLDQNGNYVDTIASNLNECLTTGANIDQTGRSFILDIVMTMCDEGHVAIVPVETTINPKDGAFDVLDLRRGVIKQWYPEHVQLNVYNEKLGQKQDIILHKKQVAIIENPLYSVMNDTNSTLRRLIDKLNLLDAIDQQSGSGKLDLIIQLPYPLKTATRIEQAEARKQSIINQLTDSKYGIAYIDGTEHITQLNRPAENNLMGQIEYLTSMLYSQLGLTPEVFAGTADEKTMLNYWNRTIEPFVSAVANGMHRSFLTKTARTQGQAIKAMKDPFRLVQSDTLADMADKFTRNEILTTNEFRGVMGFKPSADPNADELRNKNLNRSDNEVPQPSTDDSQEINQNGRKSV